MKAATRKGSRREMVRKYVIGASSKVVRELADMSTLASLAMISSKMRENSNQKIANMFIKVNFQKENLVVRYYLFSVSQLVQN